MTQVQRENSRFRALMAAQLSTAGEEPVSAAGAVRTTHHRDEHGEEVKLSEEEASSPS